jgi:alkyl hydroperoxide reductase subunit AhpC
MNVFAGPTEILAFNDRIQEFRALNTELVVKSTFHLKI